MQKQGETMKFLLCLLTVFFISCKGDNSNTPKTGDADDPNGRQEDSAQNQNLPAGFFTLVNNTSDKAIVFLPLKPGERAEKAAEISAGECLALAQEHFSSLDLVSLFEAISPAMPQKTSPASLSTTLLKNLQNSSSLILLSL